MVSHLFIFPLLSREKAKGYTKNRLLGLRVDGYGRLAQKWATPSTDRHERAVTGYGCDTKILSHPKVDRGF